MSDESYIDVDSVLDRPEKWARESLRDDGYSDAFIDEWIQVDDGLPLEVALELITSECDLKLLLIRHIQHLRDQLSNGDQTPMDWIWDGYLISWFQFMGSLNESEKLWFSERQSKIGSGPKNKTSLAQIAVENILREADAFPGTVPFRSGDQQIDLDNARKDAISKRGRDLERFRHFVGIARRIKVNGTTIEITSVEDIRGKTIIGYVFENCDLPSNEDPPMTPMTTIRSIISRLNNQPSEKSGQSE